MTLPVARLTRQEKLPAPPGEPPRERLVIESLGREWFVERREDLDTLWEGMTDAAFGEDERIPYWAELWPSSLLMCEWLGRMRHLIQGRACLDVGCGLGLTALVASSLGARVAAMDYEFPPLAYARGSAAANGVPAPLWLQMDWRSPALREKSIHFAWGGDIVYERRFAEPLLAFFNHCMADEGRIWLAEPQRTVSFHAWELFGANGWAAERVAVAPVPVEGYTVNVNLWELRRK